jgi:hypothetical protein
MILNRINRCFRNFVELRQLEVSSDSFWNVEWNGQQ